MEMNSVSEPLVAYMKIDQGPLIHGQGSGRDNEFFQDSLLMNKVSEEGIPYRVFSQIQKGGPLTLEEWARILDISSKTLNRYSKEDKVFTSSHSAVILQVTEVLSIGQDIFRDRQKLYNWLTSDVFALGGRSPLSLMTNAYGRELVLRELYSIEYGILS